MPSWWRLHDRRAGLLPWHLHATSTAVVLTPRYVVGLLAFLICVDMTQVLGVLCYQLFLGTYFPWHLYPLMLNRAVELLALLCSDGHVSSVYSVAQIFLSVLSMVICIQKQPCGKFNCVAALVLYGVLLTYQGAGPASNSIFEDPENIKEYNDVIIAVEQPDGEKYAIARLLKDVSIAPPILTIDEGSSHSNDKRNTPFKEKTRCEDAQKNLPFCKDQNNLEKSEVSASELEELYPDDTDPKIACEIRTSETPTCGHNPKTGEQIRLKVQDAELEEQRELEAATKQNEEELASNVFLASLTAEIVSFFENKVSEEGLEHCKEHDDIDS